MGYLPQFIAGDATPLGKSLVTATPTQSAARDLIGLGEADSPQFSRLGVGTEVSGVVALDVAGDGTFRNGTTPTSLTLHKTYTSATNYEGLRLDTADAAYRIGGAVGSAGGTNRNLELGRWLGDGTWNPAMTIATNGSVGIGTTTPDGVSHLQVNGAVSVGGLMTPNNVLEIKNGTNPQDLILYKTQSASNGYERFQIYTSEDNVRIGNAVGLASGVQRTIEFGRWGGGGTWVHTMTLDPWSQKLGVGTSTPFRQMEVSASSDGDGLLIRRAATGPTVYASLLFVASISDQSKGGIFFQRNGINGRGDLILATSYASEPEYVLTPDDHRLVITSQGDVGIGIKAPGAKLNVNGNTILGGNLQVTGNVDGTELKISSLPTTDPAAAGQIWNDSGTLKISAG